MTKKGSINMSLRLITSPQATNVVPLRLLRMSNKAAGARVTRSGQLSNPLITALLVRLVASSRCESCASEEH
jgi:hypothetical protein